MCGEQHCTNRLRIRQRGSPPRVRGTAISGAAAYIAPRITPACAGNRASVRGAASVSGDHPRVCGEQLFYGTHKDYEVGSPPRVRGTDCAQQTRNTQNRITPACAGNRWTSCGRRGRWKDHPRVCGEQKKYMLVPARAAGSPPRVRGTVAPGGSDFIHRRITPACAGNSFHSLLGGFTGEDHPRVCGEQ